MDGETGSVIIQPKIKVLDALMGSGKTTRLIEDISNLPMDQKFIVVVPLLSETVRFAGTVTDSEDVWCDYQYDKRHLLYLRFIKHPKPKNKDGSKLTGLTKLLEDGENIVTTHSLFRNLTKQHLSLIKSQNYLLVIDECLSVFEEYLDIKTEIKSLLASKTVYLEDDGVTLKWAEDKRLERYQQEISLCDSGSLLLIDNKVILWEMSIDIIQSFSNVWLATYLFEGSYFAAYLKFHDVPYSVEVFGGKAKDFKNLVTIVEDDKMNKIGERTYALSSSSLKTASSKEETCKKLKSNLTNLYTNKYKVPVEQRLWTTFKSAHLNIAGKGYTKCFLALNTKATNDHCETSVLAYCANLFANPSVEKYLYRKNTKINEDQFALSEMVQWIYRSRIRKGQPVVVYVPSSRMRGLLKSWLDGKFD